MTDTSTAAATTATAAVPSATTTTPTPTPPPSSSAAVDVPPSINLLLLITGSIAAIKTGQLLDQLATERCTIRIAATKPAFHFLQRARPSRTGIPFQSIITDDHEWAAWQAMDDVVVHIELRRWADMVVLVPLDANSLAKMACGLCDNLVTSIMRAWEVREKPVIVCPAMNTAMWCHPITATHLRTLRTWYAHDDDGDNSGDARGNSCREAVSAADADAATHNNDNTAAADALPVTLHEAMFQVIGPVSKRLGCGDVGMGGMASVEEIARAIRHTMQLLRDRKRALAREAAQAAAAAAAAAEVSKADDASESNENKQQQQQQQQESCDNDVTSV